jgi:ferrochelatase
MKEAILLLAHGTPDVLGEMAKYLSKVTAGRPMPPAVIEELQHRYAEIGLRD